MTKNQYAEFIETLALEYNQKFRETVNPKNPDHWVEYKAALREFIKQGDELNFVWSQEGSRG